MKRLFACAVLVAALAVTGVVAQSRVQRPVARAVSTPVAQAGASSKIDGLIAATPLSGAVTEPVAVTGGLVSGAPGKDPSIVVFRR